MTKIIPEEIELVSLEEIGCHEDLVETRDTIEGNSLQKAEYVFEHYNSPCISDDTGLEVAVLNGEPGVLSARYAGDHKSSQDNIELLLKNLKGKEDWSARFKTVITFIEEGNVHQFEGIIEGRIIDQQRGENGFGYDPVFIPGNYNETFAELPDETKNLISHRAIATQKLIRFVKENY